MLTLPSLVAVALAADPRETPHALLGRAEAMPAVPAEDLPIAPPAEARRAAAGPDTDLAAELWPALCSGEVHVAYQPIVALGTLARHDRGSPSRRWPGGPGRTASPCRRRASWRPPGDRVWSTCSVPACWRRASTSSPPAWAAGAGTLGLAVNVAPEQLAAPGFAAAVLGGPERPRRGGSRRHDRAAGGRFARRRGRGRRRSRGAAIWRRPGRPRQFRRERALAGRAPGAPAHRRQARPGR